MTTNNLMAAYGRLPIAFEKGDGVRLYDINGKEYIDAIAGIGVCGLGHCHPAVTQAVNKQVSRLVHTSNMYHIPLQEQLAARLCQLSGMENCFFSNSGAEANEAALKIARLHGHNYIVEVELSAPDLDTNGFVLDYRELAPLKHYIDDELDHRHLNDVFGDDMVTSERLAREIYDWCKARWDQVSAVRVSETPKTWAEYRP